MILALFVGASAAIVPFARGRLMKLADLRFRKWGLLVVAVALQAWLMFVHGPRTHLREITYIVSYLFAISFLFANRRIPGMWLIGMGAAMNLIAIAANGGVMPASPHALAAAGLPATLDHYTNSVAVEAPRLQFLGDVFAIPQSWPMSNVFSAGDVCVALGAAVAIHRVTGSVLVPSGRGQFAPLLKQPTYMRLWASQAISNLGDWTYALAVGYVLVNRTHSPANLALLLVTQVAPAAIFGGLFSALPDRHSRIKLMIGADVVRAAAVGSLLIGHPTIVHIYGVAALLGMFGALFQPSLQASLPNVVKDDQIVAANAMVGATYNFALMAGPALGGLLVNQLGATPVFAMNAMSFVVSAGLIAGIKLPPPRPRSEAAERTIVRDLVEGAKYSFSTPLVRGLLIVIGLVLIAAASKTPLESFFILQTLSLGPEALGLVLGAWGLGMLLGSVAAPAVCRKWARERVLVAMIAVVGVCVLMAAQAHDLETVLLAWLVAGGANSLANVSYESVLQERTPDAFRGRVFAAFEFVTNVGFLTGAFLAGWLGTHLGVRISYVFSGSLFLAAAIVARRVLPQAGRVPRPVFVGFDRVLRRPAPRHAAGRVVTMMPLVPVPQAPARPAFEASPEEVAAPVATFDASGSVFAGSESVFALAAREAEDSHHEEPESLVFRPLPAQGAEPVPTEVVPAPVVEAEPVFEAEPVTEEPVSERFEPVPVPASAYPDVHDEVPDDPSELISSFNMEDRLRAVELAARSSDDPLVATIIKALADSAPQVRCRAAVELGRLRIAEAVPALDHAVEDPDESVRAAAVEALAQMSDESVASALVAALKDPSPQVRDTAASALRDLHPDTAARSLARALGSSSLRVAALDVLSQIGKPAVDPLVDLLAGANGLRPALGAALARVAGPEHFAEELSVLDPERRRRAVEALGAMGGSDAVESLVRALVDPEPEVRIRAAELLGELGDPSAREDLERAQYDPVPEVGEAARRALESLWPLELEGVVAAR